MQSPSSNNGEGPLLRQFKLSRLKGSNANARRWNTRKRAAGRRRRYWTMTVISPDGAPIPQLFAASTRT